MRALVLLVSTVLLLTACGSSITRGVATNTETVTTTTQAPPGTVTSTSPQEPGSESDSGTPPETSTEPSDTRSPIVTETATSGEQVLVLADAFHADAWSEGEYTRAGQSQPQKAMKAEIDCYVDGRGASIEMRLAQPTGRMLVDVAQAMDSESSGERLEFSLYTDSRLADSKTIPFTGTATLSAPLAGVAVVVVGVTPAEKTADYECGAEATALITKMAIVR